MEVAELVEALFGLAGVLIVTGFGYWQWRRSHQVDKQRLAKELEQAEPKAKAAPTREARSGTIEQTDTGRVAIAVTGQARDISVSVSGEAAAADQEPAVQEPAEQRAAEYRRALVDELRKLKILDMSKPLDLEEVYVQVQVREDEPPRYVRDDEITHLAEGDPEALLHLSQTRRRDRAAVALPPQEALRKYTRVVVLGDPGAGKTTMLRHLAFRIAQADAGAPVTLPVHVELWRFIDSDKEDLLDYVDGLWAKRYGFAGAKPYIERELAAGHAALLLDGLDEVLGGESADVASDAYRKVIDEVDRLATRFPKSPIAVTCRRAGWRGGLPAFQTLEVLDFDWDQVQEFLKNWFSTETGKGEDLRRLLSGNLRMQTLAANPLILTLIAMVYERELELPERRAELYNRCVHVLLKEWDAHRGIRRFTQFTTDRKRDLLEEIAWKFHQKGLRYFQEAELLEVIAEFLPTIALEKSDAEAILDEIAAQYGLLKVQAHGWYGFMHLTLQEYFAALAANDLGESALNGIIEHRHDPWWEEVVLLLAGRMSDASPLLLGILGRDPADPPPDSEEPLAADDDIFHGDLFLAARCLVGTPRVRQSWLRERILAEVRGLLLDQCH